MALYKDIQYNLGKINTKDSVVGTVTGATFSKLEKGLALETGLNKYVTYASQLLPANAFSVVVWARLKTSHVLGTDRACSISANTSSTRGCVLSYSASSGVTALLLGNNNYRFFNYIPDLNWHCYVFTLPGSAQADISSSQLYVDAALKGVSSTAATTAQDTRSDFKIVGGGLNASGGCYISRIRVFDTVLTQTEINAEQIMFEQAGLIEEQKTNFTYPKPTDLSYVPNLIAAYNMIPNGTTLVNIKGGTNGVVTGALMTRDGMSFDGVDDKVVLGNLGNIKSIAFRIKLVTTTEQILEGAANAKLILANAGTLTYTDFDNAFINGSDSDTISAGVWNNVVITSTTDVAMSAVTLALNNTAYGAFEMEDLRFYSNELTSQQAKDYSNSFNRVTFRETFADSGASGIAGVIPTGFEPGTGVFKISELALAQGTVYQSDFSAGVDGWLVTGGTLAGNIDSIGGYNDWLRYTCDNINNVHCNRKAISGILLGRTYKITFQYFIPSTNSILTNIRVLTYAGNYVTGSILSTLNTATTVSMTFTAIEAGGLRIYGNNGSVFQDVGGDDVFYIRDMNIVEIPPLPTLPTGTKFLECSTAGTLARQSQQSYGSWEFDVFKGSDANSIKISIQSPILDVNSGYQVWINSNEAIYFRYDTFAALISSNVPYITNNTWYRIKVARLKSPGVFKDIPTLQTSACVNVDYTTFTSNGRYGFSAIADGTLTHNGGTADEISITSGVKYLVEFNLQLNSGTAPTVSLGQGATSNDVVSTNGRNSIILTATNTTTGSVDFRNISTASNYTISGLTIRRIYDANSFAVFIKGGAFGSEYTLVSTVGGTGTNPTAADATYTTSEYCVLDLDAADRCSNFLFKSDVEQ